MRLDTGTVWTFLVSMQHTSLQLDLLDHYRQPTADNHFIAHKLSNLAGQIQAFKLCFVLTKTNRITAVVFLFELAMYVNCVSWGRSEVRSWPSVPLGPHRSCLKRSKNTLCFLINIWRGFYWFFFWATGNSSPTVLLPERKGTIFSNSRMQLVIPDAEREIGRASCRERV